MEMLSGPSLSASCLRAAHSPDFSIASWVRGPLADSDTPVSHAGPLSLFLPCLPPQRQESHGLGPTNRSVLSPKPGNELKHVLAGLLALCRCSKTQYHPGQVAQLVRASF